MSINCSSNKLNNDIIGHWNWVESSGGFDGRTLTPESTGDIMKLEYLELKSSFLKMNY